MKPKVISFTVRGVVRTYDLIVPATRVASVRKLDAGGCAVTLRNPAEVVEVMETLQELQICLNRAL